MLEGSLNNCTVCETGFFYCFIIRMSRTPYKGAIYENTYKMNEKPAMESRRAIDRAYALIVRR